MDKQKVVLITGAARRIGAVMAAHLHEAGYRVLLHCRRSKAEGEALCARFNHLRPASAACLVADLSVFSALAPFIDQALHCFGRLDALINNAAAFTKTPLGQATEADWEQLMALNLKAPFFLSQLAYPHLVKTEGAILHITDTHLERPLRDYAIYGVSKAGLAALTRSQAKEMGPFVRVNALAPGLMLLPEGDNSLTAALQAKIIQETALKKIGCPEALAKAALFLLRDADYITGQVLAVDGGRLL